MGRCTERAGHRRVHALVQAFCVASHSAGAAAAHAAAAHATAALPAPGMRCAGPVTVAGLREGSLWLLDARGQPFVISLAAAGLRARMLAAAGASGAARAAAERGAPARGAGAWFYV